MCMWQKKPPQLLILAGNKNAWPTDSFISRPPWLKSQKLNMNQTLNITITWRWDIHNRLIAPIKYALFSLRGIMFSLWQGNTERESHTFHGSASLWCQRGVQTSVSFGRLAWTPAQKTKWMRCGDARWGFAAYEAVTPRLAAFVPLRSW